MHSQAPWHRHKAGLFAALVCGLLGTGLAVAWAQSQQPDPAAANPYVDAKVCAACHATQAESYRQTGMGRSFYRAEPQNMVEDFTRGIPFEHKASESRFTMIQRDGKYYQRRSQTGYQGRETNIEEKQIDFIMGSGNHARTYLHRTNRNTLQQLPLGWYPENGGTWAMSPGYDHPDHEFSLRQITYECMFCHNGYPAIPKANEEVGAEALFNGALPEGIDCQRCHGPGGRHVALVKTAGATAENVRSAIVNPARLSADRAMDVCSQCHLQTNTTVLSHSVRKYDRGPFSYTPGEPLRDFRLTYDRPADSAQRFEIVSSVYRLQQSACFLKSEGKLRCTTCHDPHNVPRGEAAVNHYNDACRQCHSSGIHRQVNVASTDCVSCHMPKRRTDDVVHAVMTDHWIQRRKPERDLLAPLTERAADTEHAEPVVAYPGKRLENMQDQLDLAVAQVREVAGRRAGIARLAKLIEANRPQGVHYHFELAEALAAEGQFTAALPYYETCSVLNPASAVIQQKLAAALVETNRLERAESILRTLVKSGRDNPDTWRLFGQLYARQGKTSEAVAAFEAALKMDPDLAGVRNNLGSTLAAASDLERAEKEFRESVRVQPNLAEAHANLANVLSVKQDYSQASYHFETAIRLDSEYAAAHLDYGQMLSAMGQAAAAEKQVAEAVRASPRMYEAREMLGSLLFQRGDTDGAIRELQAAVRIRPDSGNGHLALGAALNAKGDRAGSLEHLRIAAQSADPNVNQAAAALLKRLNP